MRNVPIIGINMDTKQAVEFESIRQFARFINADQTKRSTAQRRVLDGGGFVTATRSGTQWYIERY